MWYKHEVTSSDPQNPYKKLGVIMNAIIPILGRWRLKDPWSLLSKSV